MKVDDFIAEPEAVEPEVEYVTSLTPSGIEVAYSWAPRRHYKVRWSPDPVWVEVDPEHNPGSLVDIRCRPYMGMSDWLEVPSVTSVLGVLDKSGALTWWGMKVGVEGVLDIFEDTSFEEKPSVDKMVALLTERKATVNHVKDKAADRGVNIHSALEGWAVDQSFRADPDLYAEHERGYVVGLNRFLDDLGQVEEVEAEVMVGSLAHGFAGRFDLRFRIPEDVELVTKCYPKRADKREVVPAGRVLGDLKTSKDCYPTHSLQLEAYEAASIECGYGPTDYRAVIHVTENGSYEFRRTNANYEDFLSVRQAWQTMQRKDWFA